MKILDVVLSWLLIAFGVVHLLFTPKFDPSMGIKAIWFASAGLLFITIAALNLLRVAYATVAKGVYIVSVIANVVLVLLMLFIATRAPIRSNPQVMVGLILAGLLTGFSALRRASKTQARQMQSGN